MNVGDWVQPKREAWDKWIALMKYTEQNHPYPSPQPITMISAAVAVLGCIMLPYPYRWWQEDELVLIPVTEPAPVKEEPAPVKEPVPVKEDPVPVKEDPAEEGILGFLTA